MTERPQDPAFQGCTGFENIPVGSKTYNTTHIPDLDVCTFCYSTLIAPYGYRNFFQRVDITRETNTRMCDFAIKLIRDAWIMILREKSSLEDYRVQSVHMDAFRSHFQSCQQRIKELQAQIETLNEETKLMELQALYTKQSAMLQIRSGMTMSSISSWDLSSNTTVYDSYSNRFRTPGARTVEVGNQRLADAGRMQMEITRITIQRNRCLRELSALTGIALD